MQEFDHCKTVGPDGLHPSVPRELAYAIVILCCAVFEKWQSGSSLDSLRRTDVVSIFKDSQP